MQYPCYARPFPKGLTLLVRDGRLVDLDGWPVDGRLVDENGEIFADLSDIKLEGAKLLVAAAADGFVYLLDFNNGLTFAKRYQVMRRAMSSGAFDEWGLQLWPTVLVRDEAEGKALIGYQLIDLCAPFEVS